MLLVAAVDNAYHPINCDGNKDEGEGEEEDKRYFPGILLDVESTSDRRMIPFQGHMGLEHDGNRKANKQHIRHNIADCGRHQLRDPFPALAAWIRRNLPVVLERMTFAKGGDDHSDKGHYKKIPDDLEAQLVRPFPSLTCQPFQEFRDGEFCDPETAIPR